MPATLDDFSAQADDAADVLLVGVRPDRRPRRGDRAAHVHRESMDTLVELGAACPPRPARARARRPGPQARSTTAPRPPAPSCGGGIDEVPPMFLRSFSDG